MKKIYRVVFKSDGTAIAKYNNVEGERVMIVKNVVENIQINGVTVGVVNLDDYKDCDAPEINRADLGKTLNENGLFPY